VDFQRSGLEVTGYKDDPDIRSLQGQPGVLYYVVSDRLIDNIDAFVAGSPRDVVTA
jgi:hypothetical protein